MVEQFFKLKGWQNKLSFIWKGPSWRPGLPRLGNHEYPSVKYPIEFYHPNIPMVLSIYTFAHFLYVFVQYTIVLKDTKVECFLINPSLLFFLLSELFINSNDCLLVHFTSYSNNMRCHIR